MNTLRYVMAAGLQTFLFTDLVGFTAPTAERGDDHAADVALDFCVRARTIATTHHAEVVKTLGDGVMLRCPDPTDAVHVGLELAAASGGEVLVSASTALAAAPLRAVRLGEPRLHRLRNVVEPVMAHSASAAPSLTTRLTARLPCLRGRMTLPTPPNLPEALA